MCYPVNSDSHEIAASLGFVTKVAELMVSLPDPFMVYRGHLSQAFSKIQPILQKFADWAVSQKLLSPDDATRLFASGNLGMIDRVVKKIEDLRTERLSQIVQLEKEIAGKVRGLVAKKTQLSRFDKTSDQFTAMFGKIAKDEEAIDQIQSKIDQIRAEQLELEIGQFADWAQVIQSLIGTLDEISPDLLPSLKRAQTYYRGGASSNKNGLKFEEQVMADADKWIERYKQGIIERLQKYIASGKAPLAITEAFSGSPDDWKWQVIPNVDLTLRVVYHKKGKAVKKKSAECDAIIVVNGYLCAFVECKTQKDALSDAVYQIMRAMWMSDSVTQTDRAELEKFFAKEYGESESMHVQGFEINQSVKKKTTCIVDSDHCALMSVTQSGIIFTRSDIPDLDASPSVKQQVAFTLCGHDPDMMIQELRPLLEKGLAFTLQRWQETISIFHEEVTYASD